MHTYDPILGERQLSRFSILQRREPAEPGVALVVLREGSGLAVIKGRRLSLAELLWDGIQRVVRVNMAEHTLEWQSWLYSQSDEWVLSAHIRVRCAVSDPCAIVEEQVHDARWILEPVLAEHMRETALEHGYAARGQAERAINQRLRELPNLSRFFELRWIGVQLTLDDTLADLRRRHLQSRFYLENLREGRWSALALQLAQDPASISAVVNQITTQHDADMRVQLDALKLFLEQGAKEGYQLEAPANEILRMFHNTWQMAVGSLPRPDAGGLPPIAGPPTVTGE